MPLSLAESAVREHVALLNTVLADSIVLHSLYKKHHWHVAGPTFYQLHLLFDKHAEEILHTIDKIAERIQMLGGVATGMPQEVVSITQIKRAPTGQEAVPALLARTVEAHAVIIKEAREAVEITDRNKDYGTSDLLISDILRMHEMQVWFISQHLVDTPVIRVVQDASDNV